jgi:hypothetical protein
VGVFSELKIQKYEGHLLKPGKLGPFSVKWANTNTRHWAFFSSLVTRTELLIISMSVACIKVRPLLHVGPEEAN